MAPNNAPNKIPAWQRATSLPGAEDVKASPPHEETKAAAAADEKEITHEPARSEASNSKDDIDGLKEQASRFLSDPAIKDASREKKAAFLESKGLKREEVDLLLSSSAVQEGKTQPAQATAQPQSQPPAQPTQPRDLPPVISYPEFLVQSEKPPPLVTKTLLLNTAYVTAGIYSTLYALSKYIIHPMQAQLTDSRHDLLTHSTNQLDAFNSRLAGLVSSVPHGAASRPGTSLAARGGEDDDASETSDPTELFHRDFGTQTSTPPSRRASLSSPTSPDKPTTSDDATTLASLTLSSLTNQLKDLTFKSEAAVEKDRTSKELADLVTNLNEMAYTSASYYKYGAGNAGGYGWASGEKAQEDEVERIVKEVKALKGRFLGVRNFPRAVGR